MRPWSTTQNHYNILLTSLPTAYSRCQSKLTFSLTESLLYRLLELLGWWYYLDWNGGSLNFGPGQFPLRDRYPNLTVETLALQLPLTLLDCQATETKLPKQGCSCVDGVHRTRCTLLRRRLLLIHGSIMLASIVNLNLIDHPDNNGPSVGRKI